jgi:hypothetical protein
MQTHRIVLLLLIVSTAAMAGCRPPPAPEGLDDSTSYMMREFYKNDALFNAGIQGFMNWYFEEGFELTGVEAGDNENQEPLDSFTVGDLVWDDVSHFPLEGPRTIENAKGVVSLAEMDCVWTRAEDILLRPDQDTVFDSSWEEYARTYVTPRAEFQDATTSGEFGEIAEDLSPFEEDFDAAPFSTSLLFTENVSNPATVAGVDLPPYDLRLDLRHGVVPVVDEAGADTEVGVLAILTYNLAPVYSENGGNGLIQSYSVEINVERPGDKTLRMLAVWAEPLGIDSDSTFVLSYAVNQSLTASNRLSDICSGVVDIPAE